MSGWVTLVVFEGTTPGFAYRPKVFMIPATDSINVNKPGLCAKRSDIDASVIVVTWNGWNFTRECLKSLTRHQSDLHTEIIVVDNASSDGTPDLIQQEFPNVRLIENPTNIGFAKANNIGMRVSKGNYVCLINSDVSVLPHCLAKVVDYMEHHPSIGILGPKMLSGKGETRRSCMRFPTLWSTLCRALAFDTILKRSRLFGGFLMTDFEHDRVLDVDVLNGWFWVVRHEALSHVGFLDEQFFIYGEDIDWCYRFKKAGWRVVFYPEAEAKHYGGGSSATAPIRFYLEKQKANAQYWMKYHGRLSRLVYFAIVWLHELLRICGYAGTCVLGKSSRAERESKLRRSVACLSWLAHSQSDRES